MATENNIFSIIATGVGNANQNIVDTYKLLEDIADKIDEIHQVLFPQDIEVANEGGEPSTK
jgi:hypothetical protein